MCFRISERKQEALRNDRMTSEVSALIHVERKVQSKLKKVFALDFQTKEFINLFIYSFITSTIISYPLRNVIYA